MFTLSDVFREILNNCSRCKEFCQLALKLEDPFADSVPVKEIECIWSVCVGDHTLVVKFVTWEGW